ncbi:MAG: methionyl-tRNA formyltransferase [Candidatus Omnitrophica bacterium]|nr:methionyl-tRNA formyltransferase [Candidatus Omnitrophota bacterium]MDD5660342.1 methionyl-tRNA formyltransferase [Candidatus Omnitrophota bacterium]
MKKSLKLSILIDNPGSWFNYYLDDLKAMLRKYDLHIRIVRNSRDVRSGDILFLISCDRILKKSTLILNKHNIVVHESDLPRGRGWSPMTWQAAMGKMKIPVTLFDAFVDCDSGDYYLKDYILLDGTELIEDIRRKQAAKTIEMIDRYLSKYPMRAKPQKGAATYYRRRTPADNQLNIFQSIRSQFNIMRVADNERYPLYFLFKGKKYILKIYKAEDL